LPVSALSKWFQLLWLPMLTAFLPWSLTYRVLRYLAKRRTYFDEYVSPAAAPMADVMGPLAIAAGEFHWRYRLLKMIDQADAWIAPFRTRWWINRYVDVQGEWPKQAFIALGFHYGAGIWVLKHLRLFGPTAHLLAWRFGPEHFPKDRLTYLNMRWRKALIESAAGAKFIYTGGALKPLQAALGMGRAVVGVADSPQHVGRGAQRTTVMGRDFALPTGVFELARRAGVPLIPWAMHFDHRTGRRTLRIYPPLSANADNETWTREYTALLEQLMCDDPAGWHLWPQFAQFAANADNAASPTKSPQDA
jgi:phosphatidylinositol dimannoside acyltransferase